MNMINAGETGTVILMSGQSPHETLSLDPLYAGETQSRNVAAGRIYRFRQQKETQRNNSANHRSIRGRKHGNKRRLERNSMNYSEQ